jgi:hypothetical protein
VKAAKIDKARGGRLASVSAVSETIAFLTPEGAIAVPSASVRAAARDGGGSKVAGVSGTVERLVPLTAPAALTTAPASRSSSSPEP